MGKLIKLYFVNALKLNHFSKGPNVSRMRGFAVLIFFGAISVLFSIGSYAWLMGDTLKLLDALIYMPAIFMVSASILILISTIFSIRNTLFGFKDFDSLMSMPLKTSTIVTSRLAILYIYELFFALVIMLPALAVYVWFERPDAYFYPVAVISVLVLPVIPVITGSLLGTLVALVASRFRKTNIFRTVFLLIVAFGAMALSFSMNSFSSESASLVTNAMRSLEAKYPPVGLFAGAISGSITDFLLFAGASIVLFVLFSMIVGKLFKKLNSYTTAVYTRGNYKLGELKASGAQSALFFKEVKTYFSSTLYFVNTGFGVIILLVLSIAAAVMGLEKINELLGIPDALDMLIPALPLALAFFVSIAPTTSCSISMEGNRFRILKTLPVSPASVFNAKLGLNLAITVPPVLISSVLLAVTLKPALDILPYFILTPLVYCFLSAAFGLVVNLHTPKLDWKNEAQVVKQSASVMIAVFTGMAISGAPMIILFTTGLNAVLPITTLAAAVVALLLLVYLYKRGPKVFMKID